MLKKIFLIIGLLVTNLISSQELLDTTDIIAYYPFDGNTMDYSGNNNHAYNVGTIEFNNDRLGEADKSIEIKGDFNHLNVPNSRSLVTINEEFTLASWVYMNEEDGWSSIISKSSSIQVTPFYGLNLSLKNDGIIDFTIYGKSQRVKNIGIKKQKWFHIAVVVKGDLTTYYINGSLIGNEKTKSKRFDKNEPLEIGRGRKGSINYLNGRLDDMLIFSRALDQNEIEFLNISNDQIIPSTNSFMAKDENVLIVNADPFKVATVISKNISYANKTKSENKDAQTALGPRDDSGEISTKIRSYSLGCQGEVILEFTDFPLTETPGPDLIVFEVGPVAEPTNLSISKDGINWIEYGDIKGGVAMIDLIDCIKEGEKFYFIKLIDLGTQCESSRAGADIDAVAIVVPRIFEHTKLRDSSEATAQEDLKLKEKEIVVLGKKEIKVFTKTVKIKVWDHLQEDGDIINLYLNDQLLFSHVKVSKKGEFFDMVLQPGENIIQVKALNEGRNPPNTSAIKVIVNKEEHQIILSARKGQRDSLKIMVE